jgi:hypothetical protein
VCRSGQIVKIVVPDPNSGVREDIDVKGKDPGDDLKGKDLTPAMIPAITRF